MGRRSYVVKLRGHDEPTSLTLSIYAETRIDAQRKALQDYGHVARLHDNELEKAGSMTQEAAKRIVEDRVAARAT